MGVGVLVDATGLMSIKRPKRLFDGSRISERNGTGRDAVGKSKQEMVSKQAKAQAARTHALARTARTHLHAVARTDRTALGSTHCTARTHRTARTHSHRTDLLALTPCFHLHSPTHSLHLDALALTPWTCTHSPHCTLDLQAHALALALRLHARTRIHWHRIARICIHGLHGFYGLHGSTVRICISTSNSWIDSDSSIHVSTVHEIAIHLQIHLIGLYGIDGFASFHRIYPLALHCTD